MLIRLLIAFLLLASPSWAAVTEVGTATLGVDQTASNSLTISRTVTSGSKGLTVQLSYYNGSGAVSPPTMNWNTSEAFTLVTSGQNAGGDFRVAIYFLANPTSGTHDVTATFGGNTEAWRAAVREWSNVSGMHGGANATGTSTTPSVNVASVVSGEVTIDAVTNGGGASGTAGSGQSTTNMYTGQLASTIYSSASTDTTSTGTVAMDWTITSAEWTIAAAALVESASLEQEGFRWGVDDGNEASHGWEASQDTSITIADNTNRLLRVVVNAPAVDPPSAAYALRYQKNGAGGYTAVPLVASNKVTPVIETGDATNSGNDTASSSWAVSHPAASTGDLLIFIIGWDDSTNTTSVSAPSGPNGETLTSIAGPIASNSDEVRMQAWYTVATGAWSASTITFTPNASEQWTGTVIKIPAGEFDGTTPIGASNTRSSTGTAETNALSPSLTAGGTDGSGKLVWAAVVDADPLVTLQAGNTSIANVDQGATSMGVAVRDTAVTDSESVAGGDTWSIASDSWASLTFVVRAPTINNEVYISASANIAAGGEATTARLTAPSGKTTSDFVTGRRWDNENGTDTIDITTDDYTEVEWNVFIASSANPSDYFDFRVYEGSAPFATYTVTPRWTIPAAGGSVTRSLMLMGVGQ